MGKRGPQPVPSALKVLAGNPGGKRLPVSVEASPLRAVPEPPSFLSADAKLEWKRLGQELLDMGLLTNLDMAAFSGYCQAFGTWVRAQRMIRSKGMLVKENGVTMRNPWCKVSAEAFEQVQKGLAQFGLTPATRVRMNPGETGGEEDELVRAMNRKLGNN